MQDDKYPTVMAAVFVEQPTPFIEEFFEKLKDQVYPKSKINLFIHNTVSNFGYIYISLQFCIYGVIFLSTSNHYFRYLKQAQIYYFTA